MSLVEAVKGHWEPFAVAVIGRTGDRVKVEAWMEYRPRSWSRRIEREVAAAIDLVQRVGRWARVYWVVVSPASMGRWQFARDYRLEVREHRA